VSWVVEIVLLHFSLFSSSSLRITGQVETVDDEISSTVASDSSTTITPEHDKDKVIKAAVIDVPWQPYDRESMEIKALVNEIIHSLREVFVISPLARELLNNFPHQSL